MKEVNFYIPNWENEIAEKHSKLLIARPKRAKSQYDPIKFYFNQKSYYNFVSNDYLSLACHSNLIEGLNIGASKFGVGSTGAATLSGYTELHDQLSTSIAKWLGFEKCLIFSSGYQLNIGVFSALTNSNSTIWFDKRCHASHIDGILLSKSKFISFIPEEFPDVSTRIASQKNHLHIILTEGIFSMDGTCTYLKQVLQLKKYHADNILLIIDDAHGIATINDKGKGTLEPLEINLVDILIGTFGKSFGTQGGFLVSSSNIADYLSQTVRSHLFTTSLSPAIVSATLASLLLVKSEYGALQRLKLANNIKLFQRLAIENNLNIYNKDTNYSPIQLIILNDEQKTSILADELMESGFFVGKICYPTVARNNARLRISLNAEHKANDIEQLIKLINYKLRKIDEKVK